MEVNRRGRGQRKGIGGEEDSSVLLYRHIDRIKTLNKYCF
jgi:hypothetical protein